MAMQHAANKMPAKSIDFLLVDGVHVPDDLPVEAEGVCLCLLSVVVCCIALRRRVRGLAPVHEWM